MLFFFFNRLIKFECRRKSDVVVFCDTRGEGQMEHQSHHFIDEIAESYGDYTLSENKTTLSSWR